MNQSVSVFSKYLKGFKIAMWDYDIIMEHVICNCGHVLFCRKCTNIIMSHQIHKTPCLCTTGEC